MKVSATFEANAKTSEVAKQRMSTFDNPAEFAQSTAVFCAALGDYWFDAAFTQPLTMRLTDNAVPARKACRSRSRT